MTRILRMTAAFALLFAAPLMAQDRPVVVELFTSQGCSSCPPADEMLSKLEGRDDVIAIALHVDYWDYIGWKDKFGHADHVKRQRAYATAAGRRTIYTPEMVVQGQTDIVGAKPMALSKAIAEHARDPKLVDLAVTRQGDTLSIAASAGRTQDMDVHMLRILPEQDVKITRGENRGRTITYTHVAQGLKTLAQWDGRSDLSVETTVKGDDATVVIIQTAGSGPILAAARID